METMICKECGRELPIESFYKNSRFGYANTCRECIKEKKRNTRMEKFASAEELLKTKIQEAQQMRLSEFSPRELMQELCKRGYKGELTYTRTETINISNF